jgi:hypothetical protein
MAVRADGEDFAGADAIVNSELERVYNDSPFWLLKKRPESGLTGENCEST